MKTRAFAGEEEISLLGFGLMRLPKKGDDTHKIDYNAAGELVDIAIKSGINYFDTAYVYHDGDSEPFAGEALGKYPRESYNLATKLPTWQIKSPEDVDRIFDEQLQKCRVEYFDYYLVHSISKDSYPTIEKCNIYEKLCEKKRQGKIRRLGASFHDTPALLEQLVDTYKWDFIQIQLNYVDWVQQDAKKQYEILEKRGIPVIVMEPVRGGSLVTLCDESAKIFKEADENASAASWAIRFAASLPGVLTVLSGMSNEEQLRDNIKTMTDFRPLTNAEEAVIEKALTAYRLTNPVPCTACRYCMDCPFGVDIPRIFSVFNGYKTSNKEGEFTSDYELIEQANRAHNCVKCKACVSHCPQNIDIPGELESINEIYVQLSKKAT